MSKNYNECCLEVGLDPNEKNAPKQEKVWYAYSDGKVIKLNSLEEAKKYKLYEVVIDPESKLKIQQWWDKQNELGTKAVALFKQSLREDYPEITDELFEFCYRAADEKRGRSVDYDEIPEILKHYVLFGTGFMDIANAKQESDENTDNPQIPADVPEFVLEQQPAE